MKTPSFAQVLFCLIPILTFTQCRNVDPESPKAEGFDPPIPSPVSYLAGPITFQLRDLEGKINQELDPVLIGKGSSSGKIGGAFPFRVTRSGRVRINYVNQQVRFSTPLQLWIVRPFSQSKTNEGKPFCSLQINFQSPLQVTPEWRLASQVRFIDYNWVIKPEIRVLGRDISLENLMRKLLENYQPAIESAIDGAVRKQLRLDQLLTPVWMDLQKPLLLDRQYGLWLLPKPIAIESSPISGNARQLSTHIRIALKSETVLSDKQPPYKPAPLPTLQKREQIEKTSDLQLMSYIPYSDINRVLDRTLNKKATKLAFGALTIKKTSVYGGQKSLIVKAEVSGLLDGTVYLRGRPAFDTVTNTLEVKNLDFDAQTNDVVPNLMGWLVHDSLIKVIGKLVTIPLGNEIAQLPTTINEALKKGEAGKKVELNIQDFRFIPKTIAIRPDGLQTLIRVQSKLGVNIKKL